jgi:glycosyltransferase involved in cell wall biosynthesis
VKVLLSAYACAPGQGSDPEVGWNWMQQLSRNHEVWVVTRATKRPDIERSLADQPAPNAHFVYIDLPKPLRFWKNWPGAIYVYYYLWQLLAYVTARKLHRQIGFDLVHHVTFGMYWMPSFLCLLPVPFVWGPVGGGESTPFSFRSGLRLRGRIYELIRTVAQVSSTLDPFVRLTAHRAKLALATTHETAAKLTALGCREVRVISCIALAAEDICVIDSAERRSGKAFRILSAGRLLHWKGFHFGIEAVARMAERVPSAEYWIFGSGPERKALEQLARRLRVGDRVIFHPGLPRNELLQKMSGFDVMLHPSLHDSGGFVCMEAMSAGCTVVCLDLGGPAIQVTAETGIKIPATSPGQAIRDLSEALGRLASDTGLRERLSRAGRERARQAFVWEAKVKDLSEIYSQL